MRQSTRTSLMIKLLTSYPGSCKVQPLQNLQPRRLTCRKSTSTLAAQRLKLWDARHNLSSLAGFFWLSSILMTTYIVSALGSRIPSDVPLKLPRLSVKYSNCIFYLAFYMKAWTAMCFVARRSGSLEVQGGLPFWRSGFSLQEALLRQLCLW